MEMFFRILKRDLKRKKTVNVILLLFIILASMFLASSVNNLVTVNGAVEHFIEISKVPDYFTLSVSENDVIGEYLKQNEAVKDYEILNTFNLMNEQITITDCAQEPGKSKYERTNTLCIESVPENYMKVYDADDNILKLEEGEIAFSKAEAEANGLHEGDRVKIKIGEVEQEFEISAIVKDVVFGSQMMGFKRLFITQRDFEKYEQQEHLVYAKIYCIDYQDEEKFKDGWNKQNFNIMTNVEKETIKMCYIMDMLVAAILIVVSICLILIAFLVLRFTIVFTLQEDYKEIGIMKAIGMRDIGIRSVYLIKYLAISIAGSAIGLILSFPFGNMLLKQTIVNIVVDHAGSNIMIHLLSAVVIIAIVLAFCYHSTGQLKKHSAMDAIRNGSNGERYKVKNRLKLGKRKQMRPDLYMALNDILCGFKRFSILGITFCIGTMLILLPLSAVNTLKSDDIVNLFSLSPSDAYIDNGRMDLYVAEHSKNMLLEDMENMKKELEKHGIEGYVGTEVGYIVPCHAGNEEELFSYYTLQPEGSWKREYTLLEGREPVSENEIAITDLTAEEMGVDIGDSVYFQQESGTKEYIITGTYQSMMNMGKGFRVSDKAQIEYDFIAGIICMQVEIPSMESEEALLKLKEIFPEYKIQLTGEFINSMIGGVMEQLDTMMVFIVGIVLVINSLITILMMKILMTKERGDIALLKSMGFKQSAIKGWQIKRIMIVLAAAIAAGTILSNLSAPFIIGPIFAMMGANKIDLVVNPLEAYLIYPLLLFCVTSMAAAICAGDIKKVDLREVNDIE